MKEIFRNHALCKCKKIHILEEHPWRSWFCGDRDTEDERGRALSTATSWSILPTAGTESQGQMLYPWLFLFGSVSP